MAAAAKGGCTGRRQRDSTLVRLYLGWYSNDHVEPILSTKLFGRSFRLISHGARELE